MTETTHRPDRIALVTGCARGIGFATVEKLLEDGRRVVMVDLDAPALEAAAAGLPADRVMALAIDIAQDDAPRRIDAAVRARWGTVDILVNNAGISPKHAGQAAGLEVVTLDEWNRVLAVNVTAGMRLAQQLVPAMRAQRWGRVVNISSRAGRSIANAAGPAYMTSKAAVLGLTRSIASEFARDGITANSVAPGLVETQLVSAVAPELLAQIRGRTALGRGAEPREIGAVVAFLASEAAGFVTGACIDANGGAFMC